MLTETKKKWVIIEETRYLMKVNVNDYGQQAVRWGLKGEVVRQQLEYIIMTDFLLSNTDRHFNNFGFLYAPKKYAFVSMAPIFDTGKGQTRKVR